MIALTTAVFATMPLASRAVPLNKAAAAAVNPAQQTQFRVSLPLQSQDGL